MTFLSNPLNRVILLVAIFVIVGLASYFMVVQPTLTQYSQSEARLAQDQQTYADLKRVADQKPVYMALTNQIQSRLRNVELTADPRVYIPSYLKQIEALAKKDDLLVTAVTPQVVATPSPGPSTAPASGPQAAANAIPPLAAAARVAGASNTQTGTTNGVAAATGATPVPPLPGRPGATPGPGGPVKNTAPTSARANAIAYLSQSFTTVPINMELAGTYTQLEQFLRDLNKFPKLIGVGNLTMTPGSNAAVGETPTLTIMLPINAYRLSPSSGTIQPLPAASPAAGNGG